MSEIFEEFQHVDSNQNRTALWRIFHHIKVRQPIGRKDSAQTVCRRSRRLEGMEALLYEVAQNFESFSTIQE